MMLLISLVLVILLYLILDYLYQKYKEDLNNIDEHTVHAQVRMCELERKVNMNEQMIKWLYDQMIKDNIKKDNKQSKEKKGEKK